MTEKTKTPAAKPAVKPPVEAISGPFADLASLPPRVAAIRDKILAACETGDIEALRIPIDWNEVRPLFESGVKSPAGTDPVEILKKLSFDGKGRESLFILRSVLALPWMRVKRGSFETYVWPSLAFRPPEAGDEKAQSQLWACVRFADLTHTQADGRPLVQRVSMGPDGTWHTFRAEG